MDQQPSLTGRNGRTPDGRFGSGNGFANGNPHAKRVNELRSAMMESVSPDDMRKAVESLLQKARAGDVVAIRELFDRLFGKPAPHDLAVRVEALEALIEERHEQN